MDVTSIHDGGLLKFEPMRRNGSGNRLGVYYHPGLATWVAHLGDPAWPALEARRPSPYAALEDLLAAMRRDGHCFDDDWSPV